MDRRKKFGIAGIIFTVFGGLGLWHFFKKSPEKPVPVVTAPAPRPAPKPAELTYVVQRGDFIIAIANTHKADWQSIAMLNQDSLKAKYGHRCERLSKRFRHPHVRKGSSFIPRYYCNDDLVYEGKKIGFANSLQPGDVLRIPNPEFKAPNEIAQVIDQMPGKSVVLVIDETGSMTDKRERVATWYMDSMKNRGKDIKKVLLYADGWIRELNAGDSIRLDLSGSFENTRGALEHAMKFKPDALVLVTDEPGDDWGNWKLGNLAPVVAHSLTRLSDTNMEKLAKLTHGQFISSSSPLVPLSPATNQTVARR